jgi:hypothetical protein
MDAIWFFFQIIPRHFKGPCSAPPTYFSIFAITAFPLIVVLIPKVLEECTLRPYRFKGIIPYVSTV